MGNSHVPRLSAALCVLASLAILIALAGCGSDSDETTETGAADAGGQQEVPSQIPNEEAKRAKLKEAVEAAREKQRAQEEKVSEEESAPPPEPTGPAPTSSESLPNEGSKEVAPEVPTAKGGDNSIQEFGVEGPSSERIEAAGVLAAYLDARTAGEWILACAYLSASMKEGLAQFGGQGKGSSPASCAQIMQGLTQGVPESALRDAADIRVLSMRIEDGQAFLIYENGKGTPTAIPMADEDGEWRVAALDGSALFLGA